MSPKYWRGKRMECGTSERSLHKDIKFYIHKSRICNVCPELNRGLPSKERLHKFFKKRKVKIFQLFWWSVNGVGLAHLYLLIFAVFIFHFYQYRWPLIFIENRSRFLKILRSSRCFQDGLFILAARRLHSTWIPNVLLGKLHFAMRCNEMNCASNRVMQAMERR